MSLSLCLYVCCKLKPLHQNQIFKIPITFYNARRRQSLRTVELVDHTYEGRRVARRTHTSVDRCALTALLRSRMGLLCTLFLQWCSSWHDFVWHSLSTFYRAMLCIGALGGTSHGPVSVCLSRVGVLSKRINESSWFLACELPDTRPTLC